MNSFGLNSFQWNIYLKWKWNQGFDNTPGAQFSSHCLLRWRLDRGDIQVAVDRKKFCVVVQKYGLFNLHGHVCFVLKTGSITATIVCKCILLTAIFLSIWTNSGFFFYCGLLPWQIVVYMTFLWQILCHVKHVYFVTCVFLCVCTCGIHWPSVILIKAGKCMHSDKCCAVLVNTVYIILSG